MAIAGITSNYTGRKRDISILQYPDITILDAQTVTPSFGKNARFCAGVQTLVQKYAIILLTNLGSQEMYPSFGTNFMYTLQAGISPTDRLMAAQIFHLASYSAVNTLKEYQQEHPEMPLDERIIKATLTDISLRGGEAGFDVTISTEAEDTIQFIIPLPK
jgi:hypothetical protein